MVFLTKKGLKGSNLFLEGEELSLKFILGRAGTGKTYTCLKEIRNKLKESPDGSFLILMVPEQATFQSEKMLVSGLKGMIRAQVLSFRRLAWHVLQETGGLARLHIGELGRQMLLRKLLITHREKLRAFHRTAGFSGFVQRLEDMISEIKQYGVTGKQLAGIAAFLANRKDQQILADKLGDISLLYDQLENYLGGQFIAPDDYLDLLAERLCLSNTVRGSEIWIDGFSGFTPQEYKVVEQMLKVADRVNIALCLDSRNYKKMSADAEEADVFYPVREAMQKIKAIAIQEGIFIEPPFTLDDFMPPRFSRIPAVAFMEENFFRFTGRPSQGRADGIKLVAAANQRAEVEGTAREIISLCREKGYRWRDISVILRQVESYHTLIDTIFADYKIPFFIDTKRGVANHPLAELIIAALEVVAAGWNHDSVFRYLKTDLTPVSREDTDMMENYVLEHGIKGSRWSDPADWEYVRYKLAEGREENNAEKKEEKLAMINTVRCSATRHLLKFEKAVDNSANIKQMATALFELLTDLDVPGQLEKWNAQAGEEDDLEAAQEHSQVWSAVIEMFDQLVESLGNEAIAVEDFLKIIEAGLEGIRLGLVPPGLDQVLVASLERSRNPDIKACFVLGVNDGVLPARLEQKGVFADYEREYLESVGLILAPAGLRRTLKEQFLVYIALTRSSEYLWLSYCLTDEEGRGLMPSPVINRLKKIFPHLEETTCPVYPPEDREQALKFVVNADRVLSCLALSLRNSTPGGSISPVWPAVYDWLIKQPYMQEKCRRVLDGLFYTNKEAPLSEASSRSLFGETLQASVSRCERYYACPFAHFSAYGLQLKERPVFTLQRPDMGQFYHTCLKLFVQEVSKKENEWSELSDEQCVQLVKEIVEEVVPSLNNEILLSTARYRYLAARLSKTVERAVYVLSTHARRSLFKPLSVELPFDSRGLLPALVLPLADGRTMELSGRIDRVDIAAAGDNDYLRVIDYKSSPAGLDLNKIYCGLQLQLLVYLDIVLSFASVITGREALPAGAFYFTVDDPLISAPRALMPEEVEKEMAKRLKMKGLALAEPDIVRLMDSGISGYSDLIPAGLKKDGSLYSNASMVSLQQFNVLRRYLRKLLAYAGQKILDGSIEIKPYRYKNSSACQYCAFWPVCSFDPLIPGNEYRHIKVLKAEEIWEKLNWIGN